jgi:hypothetical protein
MTATRIAKQIARSLFTNGMGEKAVRLVLIDENGRDLGGWSEQAVVTWIAKMLNEQPSESAPTRESEGE